MTEYKNYCSWQLKYVVYVNDFIFYVKYEKGSFQFCLLTHFQYSWVWARHTHKFKKWHWKWKMYRGT